MDFWISIDLAKNQRQDECLVWVPMPHQLYLAGRFTGGFRIQNWRLLWSESMNKREICSQPTILLEWFFSDPFFRIWNIVHVDFKSLVSLHGLDQSFQDFPKHGFMVALDLHRKDTHIRNIDVTTLELWLWQARMGYQGSRWISLAMVIAKLRNG